LTVSVFITMCVSNTLFTDTNILRVLVIVWGSITSDTGVITPSHILLTVWTSPVWVTLTDVVFISVGMTDTFLAVCVGWSEASALTFWITLSGVDATVFITPVGVALTSTVGVSVSVAYATFTV